MAVNEKDADRAGYFEHAGRDSELSRPPESTRVSPIDLEDEKGRPSAIESLATTLARAASQIDRLCREIHPPVELLDARRAIEVSALCLRNLIDSGELEKARERATPDS